MSLTISQLNSTELANAEAALVELISAEYPSMDLTKGRVLYELLIKPAAIFYVFNNTNLTNVKNSLSLLAAGEDSTNIDSDLLDAFLTNLRIVRREGTKASGSLTIVLSELVSTLIPKATVFTANGVDFTTTTSYMGVTASSNVNDEYTKLITSRADGSYSFVIDVVAVDAGEEANVQQSTRFTMSPTIARVIDVYAESSFTGGTSEEDNAALIRKASGNLSPKVMCTRLSDTALLKEHYPDIVDVSVIGFGDPEMLRDQHNALRVSTGGKGDIYVRTRALPATTVLVKECTLVDPTTKLLACSLSYTDSAGVYKVRAVIPEDAELAASEFGSGLLRPVSGSLELVSVSRALDLTVSDDFVPDIDNEIEGAFTRYQTYVIRFRDPGLDTTELVAGAKLDYKVYLTGMPNIAEIQDLISTRSSRHYCSDILIKPPVPCFCSASISLIKLSSSDTLDLNSLKTAISTRLSAITFSTGQLPVSSIVDVIYSELGSRVIVDLPIHVTGTILYPDGGTSILSGTDRLVAPDYPDRMVTSRTVAFYLDPADIDITVTNNSSRTV